ncbi:MAG: hypothetical protein U0V75_02980 [Ferruginibacter sp.]
MLGNEGKSTYEKSVIFNNYIKSQKSAQDFNAYLKAQNSKQGFNSFTENAQTQKASELLTPANNNNGSTRVVLQGLNTKEATSKKETRILDGLMLTDKSNNQPSSVFQNSNSAGFTVERNLFTAKLNTSVDTAKSTKISDALKLPSKNNSILESLKLKNTKPEKATGDSIYNRLLFKN